MTNEQKFVQFLDNIGCKLVKSNDTIYSFNNDGYLVMNIASELYTKNENGTLRLVPQNDADGIISVLEEHRNKWCETYERQRALQLPTTLLPEKVNLQDMLPLNLDLAYQLQEKTVQPIILAVYPHLDGTNYIIDFAYEITRKAEMQKITVKTDYAVWASRNEVPVCEPYSDLVDFCNKTFNTDEKIQAFIELNVPHPIGEFQNDYETALENVYDEHWNDGVLRSMQTYWDAFIDDEKANIIARITDAFAKQGMKLTKEDVDEIFYTKNTTSYNKVLKNSIDDPPQPTKNDMVNTEEAQTCMLESKHTKKSPKKTFDIEK